MRRVTLLPYTICTGVNVDQNSAIQEAYENKCTVVEVFGNTRGFVPVHEGKFLTVQYMRR